MDLSELSVKELREKCKDMEIKKYSKLRKTELIEKLKNAVPDDPVPFNHFEIKDYVAAANPDFKMGIHIFKKNDICESIMSARNEYPLNAIQIFTHGPRNIKKNDHNYALVRLLTNGMSVYVHSSYPTNPWNGKDYIFKHTIDQFASSRQIKARGVVLHMPKISPEHVVESVKTLAVALNKKGLLDEQKIILEMKAVKQHATQSYESPEKINRLIEVLLDKKLSPKNVGICIDTAHIYAGQASIRSYADGLAYVNGLLYPEWISLIHLNGNEYDANVRAGDKHAIPFDEKDFIWKGVSYAESGCRAFIEFAQSRNINFIVESKDHHTANQIHAFIDAATSI